MPCAVLLRGLSLGRLRAARTWGVEPPAGGLLSGQNDPLCALTPQSSQLNHSIEFMYLCNFKNQEKGSLLLLFNFFVDNSVPVESVREA